MALATAMYHTGKNPLRKVDAARPKTVDVVAQRPRQRRLHKAFLRYHDPDNWPLLREALKRMGRADLIGNGKQHLIPRSSRRAPERLFRARAIGIRPSAIPLHAVPLRR